MAEEVAILKNDPRFPTGRVDIAVGYLTGVRPYLKPVLKTFQIVGTYRAPIGDSPWGAATSTDRYRRLYIDLNFAIRAPLELLAGAIEHEVRHHLQGAWGRLNYIPSGIRRDVKQAALDLEINSVMIHEEPEFFDLKRVWSTLSGLPYPPIITQAKLEAEGVVGPPTIRSEYTKWLPERYEFPELQSAEEYAKLLMTPPEDEPEPEPEPEKEEPEEPEEEGSPESDPSDEESEESEESEPEDKKGDSEDDKDEEDSEETEEESKDEDESSNPDDSDVPSDDQDEQSDDQESDNQEDGQGEQDESASDEAGGEPDQNSDQESPEGKSEDGAESPAGQPEGGSPSDQSGNPQAGEAQDGGGQPSQQQAQQSPLEKMMEDVRDPSNMMRDESFVDEDKSPFSQDDWMLPPDDPDFPAGDPGDAAKAHKEAAEMAREFQEAIEHRGLPAGNLPGTEPGDSLLEWAERRGKTKIPWDKMLARNIKVACDTVQTQGASDLTYTRRNPNQAPWGPILPGLSGYTPKVTVIIDVSGSMREYRTTSVTAFHELAQTVLGRYNAKTEWITVDVGIVAVGRSSRYDPKAAEGMGKGFGGTRISDTVEQVFGGKCWHEGKRLQRPDIMLIITDCQWRWPKVRPTGANGRPARIVIASVHPWNEVSGTQTQEESAKQHLRGKWHSGRVPGWVNPDKEFVYVEHKDKW